MAFNMPIANSRAAKRDADTRNIQLRGAALKQAATGAAVAAETLGGEATIQEGQQLMQRQQQAFQAQQKRNQLKINKKKAQTQRDAATRNLGLMKQQREFASKLHSLDRKFTFEALQEETRIQRDALNRAAFTDIQLADLILQDQNAELLLEDFARSTAQATEHMMDYYNHAAKLIQQGIEQAHKMRNQKAAREMAIRLQEAQNNLNKKIANAKNKASQRGAILSGAFTVVGAVVGGVAGFFVGGVGAAPGAMMGASVGAGVGQVVAGSQETEKVHR